MHHCVQHDAMEPLIEQIEQADGFILASPTNFGGVTALYKRFMERLAVYAYWPWNRPAPLLRKARQDQKPALLVSSCAAPGWVGRWVNHSCRQLQDSARTIGAVRRGTLFTGLVATDPHALLPDRAANRARRLTARLL